jgi:hypothetical protein
MAPHSKPEVDHSATISEFQEGRSDGFKLKKSITRACNSGNTSAARVVVVSRTRHQLPIAIMLEAVLHLLHLVGWHAMFLNE